MKPDVIPMCCISVSFHSLCLLDGLNLERWQAKHLGSQLGGGREEEERKRSFGEDGSEQR